MIYCPNCGTSNRDGSSFCNQCGQRFGVGSKTTCPACGSDNRIENLFCEECGARLTSLVTKGAEEKPGVKGLSLPTKPMDDALSADEDAVSSPNVQSEEQESSDEIEEDIPDWLARLRASMPPESGPQEEQAPPPDASAALIMGASEDDDEETPEWMHQLSEPVSAAPEEAAVVGAPLLVEPLPSEVEPAVQEDVAEEPSEPAEQSTEPVAESAGSAVLEESSIEETSEPAPHLEEPETLAVAEPAISAQPEAPDVDQPEDLAAWLQQEGPVILETGEGEGDEAEEITFQPEQAGTGDLTPSDIPAWLEPLAPEGSVHPEAVGLERASIPSWLEDLRPGLKREEEPVEDVLETAGILSGVRGALKMVEAVDPTPGQRARPAYAPVSATEAHAAMLTRLLGEPTSALSRPRDVTAAETPVRGLHWLAFLLLFAAVLIPFFVPGLVPGGDAVPASRPAADLAAQIQTLNQGDVVLVSFDYDPGVSTELDWPLRVVLDDVRARGVNLLITSLTPTGPGLAARFDLSDTRNMLLGYLPGQEMGLQRLAGGLDGVFSVDFQGSSVSGAPLGVHSLDDVSLMLTAASSQETVRWWVEQVKTQFPSTPMGAIVSGAVEPSVRPYYASGQLVGLVSGWVGGQAYRQESSPDIVPGKEEIAAMEAQSLAHLTIALLIVLGNFAYWGKRLFGRQP